MHALDGGFRHRPDGVVVGREQHVEQPALGDLRHLDEMRKIDAGVGLRVRMTPAGDVMAAGPDEQAELHFPSGHISNISWCPLATARDEERASMTRLWAACIIAVLACVSPQRTSPAHAQVFPEQDHPHHRAVHAGRLQRRRGARDRHRIAGPPQADRRGREQARRRRRHRLFLRGEVAAGRSSPADRAGLVHHGPASVAQPALQPGDRFRADQSGRRRALHHGGAADACRRKP